MYHAERNGMTDPTEKMVVRRGLCKRLKRNKQTSSEKCSFGALCQDKDVSNSLLFIVVQNG